MKQKLTFHYDMMLTFDEPVRDHHITLKCLPKSSLRQTITKLNTSFFPRTSCWQSRDAFDNDVIIGILKEGHSFFKLQVEGEADIAPEQTAGGEPFGLCFMNVMPEFPDRTEKLWAEERVRQEKSGIYRYPTALTRPDPALLSFTESCLKEISSRDEEAKALHLMHALHRHFHYQKALTDVTTTAAQAWHQGAGVCQDYAHILVSMLRTAGFPARYVTGMLIGEGESHAWAEAAIGGFWYGLDPTNDCAVGTEHIRIGSGRDFSDCLISQGIFFGSSGQKQSIEVSVQPAG